ncbi:ThiF family adenylyltransferase [Confluentibacter sediminis]|uniref:ThiF family adenylyltransferase n=1 Tax=Confluentibacter sediminis TaxID=2219045 RepID=UPI000DABB486|nr:ThiF family adenylyltransferase [Confluentibacter sediminis]
MEKRLSQIQHLISELKGVSIEVPFSLDEHMNISGKVSVKIEELPDALEFDITILPEYPLKRFTTEAISFSNVDFLEYGHVMGNGNICIHTSHHPVLKNKIKIDFDSLKRWIWKYYYKKEKDTHYEHLIMQPSPFKNIHFSFLFTEVEYTFKKQEFGFFEYSKINDGTYFDKNILNHIVQNFRNPSNKIVVECKWSNHIKQVLRRNFGLYIFLKEPPVKSKKFIISNWSDLEPFVNEEFHKFLYDFQKNNRKTNGYPMPLLVGYNIPKKEIHWQVALLEIGNFPVESVKIKQKWGGQFVNESITWGITRNSSYDYFFGRGKLNTQITESKILIIGIGAIGSIVAKTLVKSGCTKVDIVDYDIKEPENVCRSEYSFFNGICNKTHELQNELITTSPFVDIRIMDQNFFQANTKFFPNEDSIKTNLQEKLKEYDIVIDCSTDNDLLYVFNDCKINKYINLSITNEAKELVCSVEPKSYSWTMNQYENVLDNDLENIHNPTGCWSPTFKASYNDINVLVQYAIKHINTKMLNKEPLRNFVVNTNSEKGFTIKLNEF